MLSKEVNELLYKLRKKIGLKYALVVKLNLGLPCWKSSLCDYSDAYILTKGIITITGAGANAPVIQADRNNGKVLFQTYVPITGCII